MPHQRVLLTQKKKHLAKAHHQDHFQIAGKERFFSFIGFPHTNDAANAASWCPNQHNQPLIKPSNTDKAGIPDS